MIHTRVCDLLDIVHPVFQTGMAGRGNTSPELVAAVSNAGGLGILGCLGRSAEEAITDIRQVRALTDRPFGVNFVLYHRDDDTFAACLEERVPVFSFFRGDPAESVRLAHEIGALTIHQITTAEEATYACNVGVDVLVAQGNEAGGHMGPIPLFSLLPEVVAVAGTRPVMAAGGIVDGRGLAAVLCLGASGVLMGTRFLATSEAPISPNFKQAILAASGPNATAASEIFDILWEDPWPGVKVRAIKNKFLNRWLGHEDELKTQLPAVNARVQKAEDDDDAEERGLLAGMGASRIHDIKPAGQVVTDIVAEAEPILHEWGTRIDFETSHTT